MTKFKSMLIALAVLCASVSAFAVPPTLILKNQFGEQSKNYVLGGSGSFAPSIAANSILSNLTGSSAAAAANSYSAVSVKLLPTMLLTGYVSGAGTVAATDNVLQAIQKLNGNVNGVVAAHIFKFTSAAGAGGAATEVMTVTGLLSTDTILAVSQSVKGANSLPLLGFNTQANNALTGVWSADPAAGSVIIVSVLR